VLSLLLLLVRAAHGSPEDLIARAKQYDIHGRQLFARGDYVGAVREFSAGYDLAPRPGFLLNIAQAYRNLNELRLARTYYERYLAATSDVPERTSVTAILGELDRQIAERRRMAASYYEQATAQYKLQHYEDAIGLFTKANEFEPSAELLFNLAQSNRLAGHCAPALSYYKQYIELENNPAERDKITKTMEELEECGRHEAPPQPLPRAAPDPFPPTLLNAAAPPAKQTPVYKKWWLWALVGVVVAGGVATAVALGTRSPSWTNGPDFGPGLGH
jgi:tetratricopeptide (TPR) repeat protein